MISYRTNANTRRPRATRGWLLALALSGCGGSFATPTRYSPEPPCDTSHPLAELDRNGCYGWCPIYRLTICADGTAVYDGGRWVKIGGRRKRRLTPTQLGVIVLALDAAPVEPNPYLFANDGPTQHVRHYRGGRLEYVALASSGGRALDRLLDEEVHTVDWVGTSEERERLHGD